MNKKFFVWTALVCMNSYIFGSEQPEKLNTIKLGNRDLTLVEDYRGHINEQNVWGDTKLHHAAHSEDDTEVRELLQRGAQCFLENQLGETALSLMLKKNNPTLKECFERDGGCLFIPHADTKIENRGIISLLYNGAQQFTLFMNRGWHQPEVKPVTQLIKKIFTLADNNATVYKKEDGALIALDGIDCFVKITMPLLICFAGEKTIAEIKEFLALYDKAEEFLACCDDVALPKGEKVQKIYKFLRECTAFSQNKLCNHYVMVRSLSNAYKKDTPYKDDIYWKILFCKGFTANVHVDGEDNSLLHWAALTHHNEALYHLVYNEADYKRTNKRGKTPIDLLIEFFQKEAMQDKAHESLLRIKEALQERMELLQMAESDQTIALRETIDLIQRALSARK